MGLFSRAFIALLALFCTFFIFSTNKAQADPPDQLTNVSISPIQFRFGVEKSIFQCPCLRISMLIQTLGGEIETRYILISSDALFKYFQSTDLYFQNLPVQFVNMGAAEVLWKQGHIGIGFDGVTIGKDMDLGYGDIVKTGAYFLLSAFRNDVMQLKLKTTYDFERYSINRGPIQERNFIGENATFSWNTKYWSGNIDTYWDLQPSPLESSFYWRMGVAADNRVHFVNKKNVLASAGIHASFNYDSFRDALGLVAYETKAIFYMDVSWIHQKIFEAPK